MKMESAAPQIPPRISEMKKLNGLLLQIDIERDPDFQLRLDADDVWIKKKHARAGPKRNLWRPQI